MLDRSETTEKIWQGTARAYVSVCGARSNPYLTRFCTELSPSGVAIADIRARIAGNLYELYRSLKNDERTVETIFAFLAHAADFNRIFPEWAITREDISPASGFGSIVGEPAAP